MFHGFGGPPGRAFLLAITTAAALAAPVASAQDRAPITLRSNDGTVSLTGDFLGLENNFYLVNVQGLGTMRVAADEVVCTGIVCPERLAPAAATIVEPAEPVAPQFGIHGSRTVGTTLVPNLLRGYAEHVGARFEIREGDDPANRTVLLTDPDGTLRAEIDLRTPGSGAAIPALIDGTADIGLTDRPLNAGDLEKLTAAGLPDLRDTEDEVVLGLDGIVLITHPSNPVRNISGEELTRIYTGELTNWLELGGGDLPITVHSYTVGQGDRDVMLNGLVGAPGRDEMENPVRWQTYYEMVDAVMADRGSIGFVGRWLARTNDVNILTVREVCGLHSPPSDFNLKIEGYTLARRLFAFKRPGEMHPEARAFLDWVQTKPAQRYVREVHFVDREHERMRLEDMGMMLIHTAAVEPDFSGQQYSQMMRELRGADRLSVSFRFSSGSATLDQVSVRNLEELAVRMESGEFDGFEVLLVGFADAIGARERNTTLAQARAESVRQILLAALQPETAERMRLIPLSFGELLPLSCNDDEVGRARNRRVEVWLRLPNTRSTLR
jgi:phosphate transport system substrate-binding protein